MQSSTIWIFTEVERKRQQKIQAKTNVIIDGLHSYEAAKRLGLARVLVEPLNVDDRDLLVLTYEHNKAHGVPLGLEERDKLIDR